MVTSKTYAMSRMCYAACAYKCNFWAEMHFQMQSLKQLSDLTNIYNHTNTTALEINIFTSLALKIMQRRLQKPTSTKAKTETNNNNKNTGHIYDFSLFLPCIPFNNRTNMFTFSNPKWWAVALFFWVFAICKIKITTVMHKTK